MSTKWILWRPEKPISHLPRRLVGLSMVLGTALWLPMSLTRFQFGVLQFLALSFIALGLYHLFSSGLINVFRSAFVLTLGIGIQLVASEILTFGEFLAFWPLALITFGSIVLIIDAYEDRKYKRYRHA